MTNLITSFVIGRYLVLIGDIGSGRFGYEVRAARYSGREPEIYGSGSAPSLFEALEMAGRYLVEQG